MIFLRLVLRLAFFAIFGGLWTAAGIYLYLSPNLPDAETLRDVRLQTPMRVYTRDGDLIGQFGEQKRTPLTFDEIPQSFIEALLAAEDDNFFNHRGIDIMGLGRAVSELLLTGEKGSGGSTLTMQVARNYFLSLEKTFMRKFNEILLSLEIERRLSKQEIFELYFNRVFLGHRAYGFEAASQVYYGKSMSELSLAQHAMLAGIPKAPSRNNPLSGPIAGKDRRDWILGRMQSLGYINQQQHDAAVAEPVTAEHHGAKISFAAHYAAEMARQQMLDRYGMAAYNDGFHVYTTISSELQQAAQQAVITGLMTYDQRHGYRGPERQLDAPHISDADNIASEAEEAITETPQPWLDILAKTAVIADLLPAVVKAVTQDGYEIVFADGSENMLFWDMGPAEARPYLSENSRGAAPANPAELLTPGALIRVQATPEGEWRLSQIPAAQSALVSLNPNNGAIVSIVGGFDFKQSKFNRATQAQRQPGSNFKPFVYSAALENGFSAASIINDAPVVLEDTSLEDIWRPENDGGRFYGPTRLRWALTKSRNLVSIRLLQQMGTRKLIDYAQSIGFDTGDFSADLSLALGTHAMSPLEIASAYAVLANGGYRVEPHLIERIVDINGDEAYRAAPATVCQDCQRTVNVTLGAEEELSIEEILEEANNNPIGLPEAPQVMDPRVAFIIDSILQDVITRGTGRRARVLERGDIAGKTGTTNGPMDAWFSGYNRDVVTTTWVGFDGYTPLGRREFGGTAALPIWIEYMREALRNSPDVEREMPHGVVNVRIDPETGLLASPGQEETIFEFFRKENIPQRNELDRGQESTNGNTDELIQDIFN
jgi:penicillin-binding protein 1A